MLLIHYRKITVDSGSVALKEGFALLFPVQKPPPGVNVGEIDPYCWFQTRFDPFFNSWSKGQSLLFHKWNLSNPKSFVYLNSKFVVFHDTVQLGHKQLDGCQDTAITVSIGQNVGVKLQKF